MSTRFDMELPGSTRKWDHLLIASILLLVGLGLVTLYSTTYAFAQRTRGGDGTFFFNRQIGYICLGIIIFIAAVFIKLEWFKNRKLMFALVLLTTVSCLLPFVPFFDIRQQTEVNSARWIGVFGRTFQPSELMKLALPLYLAGIFDRKKDGMNNFFNDVLPPALITSLFAGIVLLQNNFSTAVFLVLNALFMFFLAGIKFRHFFCIIIMISPFAVIHVLNSEYRIKRILSYFITDYEPLRASFQVNSSMAAINSGGFWGRGIGQGTGKIAGIPEIHSDFIFASYAEELGFLGVILFCVLFGVFAFRGYLASMRNESSYNRLLGCGLVTMIISQAFVNIAVASGALPTTGIPLPFFSAGGSSLLITMAMAGLIVNISRSSRPHKLSRDDYYENPAEGIYGR